MDPPLSSSREPCCICEQQLKTWRCLQCANDAFCDDCWKKQRPHRPGAVGIDGRPHEKLDPEVLARLNRIFGHDRNQEEQGALHEKDINTTWFGVEKGSMNRQSVLHHSNRLLDIMRESQTGDHSERFPQLVSFVGQTGAGKSTVINTLIDREQAKTTERPPDTDYFPVPVIGLINDMVPTSGDVHLYSDPATYLGSRPILYADCEGLNGGEKLPLAIINKEKQAERREKQGGTHTRPRLKGKLQKPLTWATTAREQSREFLVSQLFPRILYTFSDVIVFVLREARVFQSEVLQKLIQWAYSSIDKSINQPSLPHIIIVLNATENAIDESQWDVGIATRKLLEDYSDSINQVQALQNIVASLESIGKNISSTKELLEHYYSSITVVRIPTKGRYMLIDEQVAKLGEVIRTKCGDSFARKKVARMHLNAETLQQYVSSAWNHFSCKLYEPFDFVKEALRHNPMPQDFQGHLLNLMLSTCQKTSHPAPNPQTTDRIKSLSCLIASCVMLAASRENLRDTYTTLFENTFSQLIKGAYDQYCGNWLRCGFQQEGHICCNVKNLHDKGHQTPSGKIFAKGSYRPTFDTDAFFNTWMEQIAKNLASLERRLRQRADDSVSEKDQVSRLHHQVIRQYKSSFRNTANIFSHATCFCCVRQIPEHVLPCGHVLCTPCIRSFGVLLRGTYELECCPLHPDETPWTGPIRIKFKPRDAGVRVLCLDGGGVRGIIQLALLRSIELELGGFVQIQSFFDLIVGTSTGGIIALGLGVQNWPVQECMTRFKELCSQAFTRKPLGRLGLFFNKTWCKTTSLEAALQSAFGQDTLLFGGSSQQQLTNIKVAVTSTTPVENRPVILTNYNTAGPDRDELPYSLVRSRNRTAELKVWEAARATSAAPPYFKHFLKAETGLQYMDGAVHYNCPASIAHHERKVLWNDVGTRRPDLFLSLGTGLSGPLGRPMNAETTESQMTELMHPKPRQMGLRYLLRTGFTIIDDQLNCERAWKCYVAETSQPISDHLKIEERRRQIRLNVQLKGNRPGLDSVDEVQSLEGEALDSAKRNPDIKEVAHRLVASSFYFERNTKLDQYGARGGTINCRFEEGSSELKGLGKFLESCLRGKFGPFFLLQENYGTHEQTNDEITITTDTIKDMCSRGLFDLGVPIRLQSVTHSNLTRISLCLQEKDYPHSSERYLSISGFPRDLSAVDVTKPLPSLPTTHASNPSIAASTFVPSDRPGSPYAESICSDKVTVLGRLRQWEPVKDRLRKRGSVKSDTATLGSRYRTSAVRSADTL